MPPVSQNPSPMQEHTRAHGRVSEEPWQKMRLMLDGALPKPIEFYMSSTEVDAVWIHFHGTPHVVYHGALESTRRHIAFACVQMGAGSAAYETPLGSGTFARLLAAVRAEFTACSRIWLSGFSAGYGALRAALADDGVAEQVDGVLILDGLHSGYRPQGRPLAEGGHIEEEPLAPFVHFARRAALGDARMLLTHSEVFPGTFASTTETADYLVKALDLPRRAVLEWGPLGMQQLSDAHRGKLRIMGFAGNSAPDHVDHLHALSHFRNELFAL